MNDSTTIKFFILLFMIQCHVIDDYVLQGVLAKLKQKKFWQDNAPEKLYKYDYLCALMFHAFSWTFSVLLPITGLIVAHQLTIPLQTFIAVFISNWIIHFFVDNEKANKLTINLWCDQLIHLIQIIASWLIFICYI